MIAKPISRGFWNLRNFNRIIYSLIDKNSYIIPYSDRYISLVAKSHNKHKSKQVKDENSIKWFSNNLEKWLKKYHGVASKYLEEYLSLFVLFNINRETDYMELFNELVKENHFIKTNTIGVNYNYYA